MRILRGLLLGVGALVGLVLVAVVVVVLLAQSQFGRDRLVALVESISAGAGAPVTIEGLDRGLPVHLGFSRLTVADPEGPWLTVDNARIDWSPFALLTGTARISEVSAERVEVARRPAYPPSPEPAEESSGLPVIPVRVVLDRLGIAEIVLAEPVAGEAARLSVSASARIGDPNSDGLSATFDVNRLDGAAAAARGAVRFVPDSDVLDLDLSFHEEAGGLVGRAAAIEGLPAIAAAVKGSGTLSDWSGTLSLEAGDKARASGTARITDTGSVRGFDAQLAADISRLLPIAFAPLAAGEATLDVAGSVSPDGLVILNRANLVSAAASTEVHGNLDTKGRTLALDLAATLGKPATYAALSPVKALWDSIALAGRIEGSFEQPVADLTLTASRLSVDGNRVGDLKAVVATRPGEESALALSATVTADGIAPADARLGTVIGQRARIAVTGSRPDGAAPSISDVRVELVPLDARFTGVASAEQVAGKLAVSRLDLAAIAPFAGRPLSGIVSLDSQLDLKPDLSSLALTFSGVVKKLATGIAQADALIGPELTLSGGVTRAADGGFALDKVKLAGAAVTLSADGKVDPTSADLTADLALTDLTRLNPNATGTAGARVTLSGSLEKLDATVRASVPRAAVMDRAVRDLKIDVTATDVTGKVGATLALTGTIADRPARGAARLVTQANNSREISGLDLTIGSAAVKGAVTVPPAGLPSGNLRLTAGNIGDLTALAFLPAQGNVDLTVALTGAPERASVRGTIRDLAAVGVTVGRADLDLTVDNPTGALTVSGTAAVERLVASGQTVDRVRLTARPAGAAATDFSLDGRAMNLDLAAAGRLSGLPTTPTVALSALSARNSATSVRLARPATIRVDKGVATIDTLTLTSGSGSIAVAGTAGARIDLSVTAKAFPLAIARLFAPDLDISGTLSGSVTAAGDPAKPTGRFDLQVQRLSVPQMSANGVGPFEIRSRGALADGQVRLSTSISGPQVNQVAIEGTVPMSPTGNLDVGIRGRTNIAIANTVLATSGARASGPLTVDARIVGPLTKPRFQGNVRVNGGRFDDPVNGVSLSAITLVLTGTSDGISVTTLSARTPNGGTLSGRGTISLDAARGMPSDIRMTFNNAGLIFTEVVDFSTDGSLAVTGPLLTRPSIKAQFDVRRLDVTIPDRLGGGGTAIAVRHTNLGTGPCCDQIRAAQDKADRAAANQARRGGTPFIADLDITVSAPARVFVRGMGMDAELAGRLHVTGTTAAPVIRGGFDMRRGRFDIIGRRFTFSRGRVTFPGDTNPELDFEATTTSNGVTAVILVTGRASAPKLELTSVPVLPQDEILSRILFGTTPGNLSTGQAIALAQTVAQFAGGGRGVGGVRRALGLDDLDVGVDQNGQARVGVGKRINDNISVGVEQGAGAASSRVTVDIDVGRNVKVRGGVGATGDSDIGMATEWNY